MGATGEPVEEVKFPILRNTSWVNKQMVEVGISAFAAAESRPNLFRLLIFGCERSTVDVS